MLAFFPPHLVRFIYRSTTDEALHNFFSAHGQILDSIVMRDRETGRSRGFGFVTFASEENAQSAIGSLNDQELDGRRIKVNLANARSGGGGGGGGGGSGSYGGGGGSYGSSGYGGGGGYGQAGYGGSSGYNQSGYTGQGGGYGTTSGGYAGQGGGYGGEYGKAPHELFFVYFRHLTDCGFPLGTSGAGYGGSGGGYGGSQGYANQGQGGYGGGKPPTLSVWKDIR